MKEVAVILITMMCSSLEPSKEIKEKNPFIVTGSVSFHNEQVFFFPTEKDYEKFMSKYEIQDGCMFKIKDSKFYDVFTSYTHIENEYKLKEKEEKE